ncbi:protein ripply2 [Aquarana catesbeiana]|uniref:protein ripply2 n=1 Tax=Aquarana catesbeiana TaxID=8400 RepID=UPI003CC94FCB
MTGARTLYRHSIGGEGIDRITMQSHQTGEQRRAQHTSDAARCLRMWRPWYETPVTSIPAQQTSNNILQSHSSNQGAITEKAKLPAFQHPVKLFWPKSKCYDFLYQEAEELLKNFPVQATISLYQESDSSSEDEELVEN